MSNTHVFDKLMAMPGARERYLGLAPRDESMWFQCVADKVRAIERGGGDGVEALWHILMNLGDEKNASMKAAMLETRLRPSPPAVLPDVT